MGLNVYTASLLAAVCWGISPVISKRGLSYGGTPMQATTIVVTMGMVTFWCVLFMTEGTSLEQISARAFAIFVTAGVVGTTLGRIANYTGIHRIGASINTAVIGTHPLFAAVAGFLLLKETLSIHQTIGMVIVVTGVVILTLSQGGDLTGWKLQDLLFPLSAAAAYGLGHTIRRFGLTTTPLTTIEAITINDTAAFVGLASYTFIVADERFRDLPRRCYPYFGVTGLIAAFGLLLFFVALRSGPVAIATTLVTTSTMFALFFSHLLLGDLERVTPGVVVGAGAVVLGIVLIAT